MDYVTLYDSLGAKLLAVIDKMEHMDNGLKRMKDEKLTRNGGSQGRATKLEIRLSIQQAEAKAITEAIKAIKPMADLEKKIREVEAERKKAEKLVEQLKKQSGE